MNSVWSIEPKGKIRVFCNDCVRILGQTYRDFSFQCMRDSDKPCERCGVKAKPRPKGRDMMPLWKRAKE